MSGMQARVHTSDRINVCSMIRRVWPWILGSAGTFYEQKLKEGRGSSTPILGDSTRLRDISRRGSAA